MLELYGAATNRAYRNIWMLDELGLSYDLKPVAVTQGILADAAYMDINPNGRVPALRDENGVFWESLAINIYLARKYGGPLAPANLVEEALAIQWSLWAMTELERPLFLIAANHSIFPEDFSQSEVDAAMARLERPLDALEKSLVGNYLFGARFSVADLNVASILGAAIMAGVDVFARWKRVSSYLERCVSRPAAPDFTQILTRQRRPPMWSQIII